MYLAKSKRGHTTLRKLVGKSKEFHSFSVPSSTDEG